MKTIVKTSLPVSGMHCASCSQTITKKLRKIDGIESCEVNFATEKAKIVYDSSKTSLSDMNKHIEPLGYKIEEVDHSKHTPDEHAKHLGLGQTETQKFQELKTLKNKLKFVLPVTALVFLLMIIDIYAEISGISLMLPISMESINALLLILGSITLFWVGDIFIKGVINFAKYKVANMDTLVGIGTLTAFTYSALIILLPGLRERLNLPEETYFDVTIVVIGFITLGKYLEAKSKLKTGEAIKKLLGLQAKTALIEKNGKRFEIALEKVKVGDILVVKPATKIAVDGSVIEGSSNVDESMITGEAIPVKKEIGDNVIGGTINKQGTFKFKATAVGSQTMLSNIIKMVEDAQGSKAPIQELVDKISSIFVPIVLVVSILTLLLWLTVGTYFLSFDQAVTLGFLSFIGILVIACPCALGLATPTAIIVGTGKGAENGILVKDAESLQKLSKVNTIVTDKTGTITKGKPELTDFIPFVNDKEKLLKILYSLEENSEHPLAEAIVTYCKSKGINKYNVTNFEIIEGKGIKGFIEDINYYVGNQKLAGDLEIKVDTDILTKIANEGKTPVILMSEKQVLAIIGIADTLKEAAADTIKKLHNLGIEVILLTGDKKETAKFIAKEAGINQVIAEVLPAQKADKVKELQLQGKIVAMVGDGVNDAPALAQSDIGIAMATGTDVAIESAQLTLLKGDISKLLKAIKLSKFTMSAIKQNLFWAFIYNVIGIPLAAGLFYPVFGLLLNPMFAGLAMAFSSVSVVSNSLRLKLKTL